MCLSFNENFVESKINGRVDVVFITNRNETLSREVMGLLSFVVA